MFMEVLSEEIILNWDLNDKKQLAELKKKKNKKKTGKSVPRRWSNLGKGLREEQA